MVGINGGSPLNSTLQPLSEPDKKQAFPTLVKWHIIQISISHVIPYFMIMLLNAYFCHTP